MHIAERWTSTLPPLVAKVRSRNPLLAAFGARLMELRGKRSRKQISNRLTDLGVPLGGATLAQYEAGTVWAPDPGAMWGLAVIYERPLDELVWLLRANRANTNAAEWRDLVRPAQDQESGLPSAGGSVDVPASARARILELESEIAAHKARWRAAEDAASGLLQIIVAAGEGDAPSRLAPGGRGRHRTTR